jgi:hypothetical protein
MEPTVVSFGIYFCLAFQLVALRLTREFVHPATTNGTNKFFEDFGVWKDAPVLKGSTKFEPLPDVKNIMITGGAGFM